MVNKYILKSVEGVVGDDGKLTIPKGAKYTTLGTMVELNINQGKRAGQKFLVTEAAEGTERGTVDQFFANEYQGKAKGTRNAPAYVLTHRAAGAPADQSTLICSLFQKKYDDGSMAWAGRVKGGTTRFYLESVEQSEARRNKNAKKA